MTLILHAGTHKTGTTTLQRAFDEHRDQLAARGLHYPDAREVFGGNSSGHHPFVHAVASGEDPDRVAAFVDGVSRALADGMDVLLSAEPVYRHVLAGARGDWWQRHERYLERLASLLPTDDVRVVLLFRRRDTFAESAYHERVANGFGQSFGDFARGADRLLDYDRQLALFRRVFAEVSWASYETLAGQGLVDTFLEEMVGVAPLRAEQGSWVRRSTDARLTLWMVRAYREDPDEEQVALRRKFVKHRDAERLFDDFGRRTLWGSEAPRLELLRRYGDHAPVVDDREPASLDAAMVERIDDAFAAYLRNRDRPRSLGRFLRREQSS